MVGGAHYILKAYLNQMVIRIGTTCCALCGTLGVEIRDFRRGLKFCFQYNQLKFQLADNPGLFNRKPKTVLLPGFARLS